MEVIAEGCAGEFLVYLVAGVCLGMCIGVLMFMDADDEPPTSCG